MISSTAGRVASIRAPRMTIPRSVSFTTLAARKGSACRAGPTDRLAWGLIRVWVRQRSFSRTCS